ncbi:Gfo/Idh/MocA family protein [Paenibacillus sp. GCM10012303]|jgi:predicted dehydrogenase|uniref:Gfo/Idh/MocA family protein n=1 Tax=Paenibacillus sp. GCM10012303 TaxID=3317340 RepID=UPI00360F2CE0
MGNVKFGVIGLGNMGTMTADYLSKGEIEGAELAAVCEMFPERLKWAAGHFPSSVAGFDSIEAMLTSGSIDAVYIATPHFDHPAIAIRAFECGLHVLTEKPAGVYTKQVRQMNESAARAGTVFGIMYNARTQPLYRKLRELVISGELGAIRRTNWIVTNWYRPQSYYDSGTWRGTWAGEGGGVLINQAPHQLDLWQWTIDMMPKRIRASCYFGKNRDIEVEDEVIAFAEYENGATGQLITSTGESPGTNRYEVVGDRGKLVIEDGKMTFWRLRVPETEFNRTSTDLFRQPECWKFDVPLPKQEKDGHLLTTQNFADAIRTGTPLIAPGEEGIKGLMLSNAMHLSAWTDGWADLPVDEDLYLSHLEERMRTSRFKRAKDGAE